FSAIWCLKGYKAGLGCRRLTQQPGEGSCLAIGIEALHPVDHVGFIRELPLEGQLEPSPHSDAGIAISGWHDELVDERPDGRQVEIGLGIHIDPADGWNDDTTADGDLGSELPLDEGLFDVDLF